MRWRLTLTVLSLAALLLAGCGRPAVRTVGLTEEYVFNEPIAWSPDGSELLLASDMFRQSFAHTFENEYVVYTVSSGSFSILRRLNVSVGVDVGCCLPNGSLIATYAEGYWSTRYSIVLLNADGEYLDTIAGPTDDNHWISDLSCSPDGQRILFVLHDRETNRESMVMVNVDGSDEHTIPLVTENYQFPIISLSTYSTPAWSPDGEWIAFAHSRDIHLVRPDGSDGINLTQTPSIHEEWPTWSPDGARIAFIVINTALMPDAGWVYVMNRDGNEREQVTFDERTYQGLLWSPDGRWIAAMEVLGTYEAFALDAVLIPIRP